MGGGEPTRLGRFVRWEPSLFRPSAEPENSRVDLADVDKATGEVLRCRTRKGKEVKGRKTRERGHTVRPNAAPVEQCGDCSAFGREDPQILDGLV